MLKIERIVVVILTVVMLSSCSEYQKVLNKGNAEDRYKMATKLYDEGKYNKAINLFEKIATVYERKPQMERIRYMVSNAHYRTKSYDLAAYHFNRFISNYPKSSKIEEASFLVAHSYYLSTPKYSRDQKNTQKALQALQNFIDKYPNSPKIEEANNYFKDLTFRLEKKSFEIAKQYYHIEDYKAAVQGFENFLQDHIGSSLKEDAMYYKFKASNDLAINSILNRKEKRLEDAILAYNRFKKTFPESNKAKEVDKLHEKLTKELTTTKELIQKLKNNILTSNGL